MELFYNPERMSETEIKETFVAHQWLVDEIVSILKRQPKGAGVQHVVIVAPRGMGKTTLLLMLRFAVLNTEIAKRWQPVLFPEESYGVYDLADLWVEFLNHIASETGDAELRDELPELKVSHPDSDDLEAVALAKIKDWRNKNKKRLLMLLDNFDMILKQIGDEKDNARLRDVLMNDDTLMLVGGSTTFFKEARAYEQPLYNLFKIYNLDGLDSEQIEDLLRRRAKLDEVENFEEILRANRSRLRVLEYFTGGNPRLVLMLYRVITHSEISDVRRGLEKLLDEVTPYYKAKIEALPPQQRKILDQIARITGQTREGLTPTEIAPATRLPINHVSAQLKRLAELGYVRIANIRGRSSYYTLSEPLYAIWHQMRFSRETRKRMNWLIDFLKGWYDAKELGTECQRLADTFRRHLIAGHEREARDALEHRRYLMEAIEDQQSRVHTLESIIDSYLELSDVDALKQEVLSDTDISLLSDQTYQRLVAVGLLAPDRTRLGTTIEPAMLVEIRAQLELALTGLNDGNYAQVNDILTELENKIPESSFWCFLLRALGAIDQGNLSDCVNNIENALEIRPDLEIAWRLKGIALWQESRLEEAAASFRRASELNPTSQNLYLLASILDDLGQHDQALATIDRALQLNPKSSDAHFVRSVLLTPGSLQEAWYSLERAFDPTSNYDRIMVNTFHGKSIKAMLAFQTGHNDQGRSTWNELESCASNEEDQTKWTNVAATIVTTVAKAGQLGLARELITSAKLDEQLFPLTRALDYLLKGDETSIEKLSPEVRRIVDEVLNTLGNTSGDNVKPKRRPNSSPSRNRKTNRKR